MPMQSAANAAVLPARMVLGIDAPSSLTVARTTNPPPSSAVLLLTVPLVNVRPAWLSMPCCG